MGWLEDAKAALTPKGSCEVEDAIWQIAVDFVLRTGKFPDPERLTILHGIPLETASRLANHATASVRLVIFSMGDRAPKKFRMELVTDRPAWPAQARRASVGNWSKSTICRLTLP